MQRRILIAPPDRLRSSIMNDSGRDLLLREFDVTWNDLDRDYTAAELAALLPSYDALITSWGTPALTDEMLAAAPRLKAVAHAAGTVKHLVPRSVFDKGVTVISAAGKIAEGVAEYCLAWALTLHRRLPLLEAQTKAGYWSRDKETRFGRGRSMRAARVGVIAASMTGREFIKLLAPFGCQILLYDPYVSDEAAAQMGVTRAPLEAVMGCDIISVHLPNLPTTKSLVSAQALALIKPGAVFINSSRGDVVDEEALVRELQTGRFLAALDVFWKEPLHPQHPLLNLNNVFLTSHVAGDSVEGKADLVASVARDVVHLFKGEPLRYAVSAKQWELMA